MRTRQALWRVGVLSAATLVLLELVLQVGSLCVWWTHRRAEVAVRDTDQVVLCIGDSFTFGLGAATPRGAYPAQLETTLRDSLGAQWHVVNAGYPGRDSRDLLERIDAQLTECRPRFVCVQVGVNDMWRRPAKLDLGVEASHADADQGFRLEWRTARFARWVLGKLPAPAVAPSPGDAVEPTAAIAESEGQPPASVPSAPADGPAAERAPESPLQQAARLHRQGWDAAGRGDWERAATLFRDGLARLELATPPEPDIAAGLHHGLVYALVSTKRADAAAEHLAWLERAYGEHPRALVAQAFLVALHDMNRAGDVVAHGRQMVEQFPGQAMIWEVYGWRAFQTGDSATGRAAMQNALRLTAAGDAAARARRLRYLATMLAADEPRRALRALIDAFVADGDEPATTRALMQEGAGYTAALLDECLGAAPLDAARRGRLTAIGAAVFAGPSNATMSTLAAHLRQIIGLCRRAGAEPILVGYPYAMPHDATRRLVAAEARVALVDPGSSFAELLRTRRRDELFVGDGHCTDAGYSVLARAVHDEIVGRVR